MTAVAEGAVDRMNHSTRNRNPLATKDAGTSTAGEILRVARVWAATSRIETTEVAMSIAGRAVKLSEVKNRASRVALPLTRLAVTDAAQTIVTVIDRDVVDIHRITRQTVRIPAM